ncbi:hypothetical protein JXA48_01595 [Candidatus Woesearchaeota archaeon]|nr:hypothetical protein [Candidatus Woesearchaeota archaeon]
MIIEEIKQDGEPNIAICLDTIEKDKQALVFCASKRIAESQAEKVTKEYAKKNQPNQEELSNLILNALSTPTKQCKRLAMCVKYGIAFHHSGLNSKQRELIEDGFREGTIKVICSTPTLAAGLDLPAFRAIIKDNKRFGARGMSSIPVLEYEQMSGRAGRPGKEDYGESILIATKEEDVENLTEQYINGEVEDIYSKLAVEPVLRTYILSLVASNFAESDKQIKKFFDKTFYAKQFGDTQKLHAIIDRVTDKLIEWNMLTDEQSKVERKENQKKSPFSDSMFISGDEYVSKQEIGRRLQATNLGIRVSQIYLDPMSANLIIEGLIDLTNKKVEPDEETKAFILNHLFMSTLEMRPLLRTKAKEYDEYLIKEEINSLVVNEQKFYDISTDDFVDTIKSTSCIMDWCNEINEDKLLEKYDIRPGELSAKLQKMEWLYYGAEELARIKGLQPLIKTIKHNKERVVNGVKSELITLLRFKGIGRVRARKLYNNNVRNVTDIKNNSFQSLAQMVGTSVAKNLKEQVGETVDIKNINPIRPTKKHPQTTLGKFT